LAHGKTAGFVGAAALLTLCAESAEANDADALEPPTVAATRADRLRTMKRQWIVSAEWVTHAPLDVGLQAGLETPIGLRFGAGYGWVPSAFSSLITQVAASETGDAQARAVLEHSSYQGRTFWFQMGMRPIRSFGLYGDVGYARATLEGGLVLAGSGVAALQSLPGSYSSRAVIDLWRVEIGIQEEFADRVVVGVALGLMGILDSHTSIEAAGGAPDNPALGQAAERTDTALKRYGKVPSLTFRLGVDVL
jgi:hypothetical protein